jgi:hypothetical protein
MLDIEHLQIQYVTDSNGEKSAVILPIKQFYQLLEDFADLVVVAERVEEPTITHQQLLAELKSDGLLPG